MQSLLEKTWLLLLLRCPAETSPDEAGLFPADRCYSLTSLPPPLAAVGSLPLWAVWGV